jgi:hypothetical protein
MNPPRRRWIKEEKGSQGIAFIMNEFFRKWYYEYLLEQTVENGRISMGAMWITGNSQERKTAPISLRMLNAQ